LCRLTLQNLARRSDGYSPLERELLKNLTVSSIKPPESTIAGVMAGSLLIAGLAAELVALVPIQPGNVDWEFGTLGEMAAVGPLLLIGAAASLFVATQARRRLVVVTLASLSLAVALVLIGGVVVLALDVPLVLRATSTMPAEASRSIKVVLVKSGALLLIELTTLVILGAQGFRWWGKLRRAPV
jgi:hypothetical protein